MSQKWHPQKKQKEPRQQEWTLPGPNSATKTSNASFTPHLLLTTRLSDRPKERSCTTLHRSGYYREIAKIGRSVGDGIREEARRRGPPRSERQIAQAEDGIIPDWLRNFGILGMREWRDDDETRTTLLGQLRDAEKGRCLGERGGDRKSRWQ